MQFPAVLCTKWYSAVIDEMRQYRRFIPSLIDPASLDPTTIVTGIESCIREFSGDYRPVRRPWRTLIRIEQLRQADGGNGLAFVVIPAWSSNEVVKLPITLIPPEILKKLGEGSRLHAKVNLGAVSNEELFFEDWEI
jgi:hypothetical protein